MPTKIDWRPSQDPDDPPGTQIGEVIYSTAARAVATRARRRRERLVHVLHQPVWGVCQVCWQPWPCPTPEKQAEVRRPRWRDAKPKVSEAQAVEARDFLADWLRDEDVFEVTESIDWFAELADHIAALPAEDPRLAEAFRAVEPLLEDEEMRIPAVLYPNGYAVGFVDEMGWGSHLDHDLYFSGFVQALLADLAFWHSIQEQEGDDARWPPQGPTRRRRPRAR